MKFKKGDKLYYKENVLLEISVIDINEQMEQYQIVDIKTGLIKWRSSAFIEKNFEKI